MISLDAMNARINQYVRSNFRKKSSIQNKNCTFATEENGKTCEAFRAGAKSKY
jgi:hypothetical protein